MKLLLDTHLLLWAASAPERIAAKTRNLILKNERYFSAASLWEVAIKATLGRADFSVDAALLRAGLLENEYRELPVTGAHAIFTASLPPIHKDPFDRILVAQASIEGFILLTTDALVARYGGAVRAV